MATYIGTYGGAGASCYQGSYLGIAGETPAAPRSQMSSSVTNTRNTSSTMRSTRSLTSAITATPK